MSTQIKIALVDDDKLIVQFLCEFFESQDNITVLSTANSGNAFIESLNDQIELPDIAILDLKMKDGDGVKIVEYLTSNYDSIKIIILSSFYKPSILGFMVKVGIHAFVPKETDKASLIKVINEVDQKGHYFTPEQLDILRKQLKNKKPPHLGQIKKYHLSPREIEVLELLCRQLTAKEIASKLFVSTKTIESHKGNLLSKTGSKNMIGLIIFAVQNGIINPDSINLFD